MAYINSTWFVRSNKLDYLVVVYIRLGPRCTHIASGNGQGGDEVRLVLYERREPSIWAYPCQPHMGLLVQPSHMVLIVESIQQSIALSSRDRQATDAIQTDLPKPSAIRRALSLSNM